jgi:nucleotide-binding universal stress UspA family protein
VVISPGTGQPDEPVMNSSDTSAFSANILVEAESDDRTCDHASCCTLSGGPETRLVLTTAMGMAQLVGGEVEAVHVSEEDDTQDLEAATSAAGARFNKLQGSVADALLVALKRAEVLGAVMGTRAFLAGPRPAGSTSLQLLRAANKPLVFVPPEVALSSEFTPRRLLVPLDGSPEASRAFLEMEGLFRSETSMEITVLLTLDGLTPAMLDHPVYDLPVWGEEFLLRHCPGEGRVFEWRTGNPANAVIEVAEETNSDLIVLSFGGDIEVGHGAVIREVLARSAVPVLVLPVWDNVSSHTTQVRRRKTVQVSRHKEHRGSTRNGQTRPGPGSAGGSRSKRTAFSDTATCKTEDRRRRDVRASTSGMRHDAEVKRLQGEPQRFDDVTLVKQFLLPNRTAVPQCSKRCCAERSLFRGRPSPIA